MANYRIRGGSKSRSCPSVKVARIRPSNANYIAAEAPLGARQRDRGEDANPMSGSSGSTLPRRWARWRIVA